MIDQQLGQLEGTRDLRFGIHMPRPHAAAVFVLGEHHIALEVFLAEPGNDAPPRYVVTADTLNIRRGSDASFDTVAPSLKKGTVVSLLQPGDRWSKVEVEGPTDIEGWVNNRFIVRAPAAMH